MKNKQCRHQDHHRHYQSQMIKLAREICLYVGLSVLVLSNLLNYFYSYKYLNDVNLQWSIAMYSIAIELFLFSLFIWLTEFINRKSALRRCLSGWMTIYLLINMMGVCLGYTLHTKGFMAILFSITFIGVVNIVAMLWQKYF